MNFQRMGYIGKSFTMGALGILGTLVACGGGGVTNTVAASVASPYVLFASEFVMKSDGANDTWAKSQEGGDVTSFAGDGLSWAWDLGRSDSNIGGNPDWLKQQQAYGIVFAKAANADPTLGYAGLSIKAPENGSVDVSLSGSMVIQTGNGNSVGADSAAFMGYTIELAAGTQGGAPNFAWPKKCTYQLALTPGSRPQGPNGTGAINLTNPHGLQTYRIALNTTNFTCTGGTLSEVKADLKNISVLVAAANNNGVMSDSAAREVFIKIGQISFTK